MNWDQPPVHFRSAHLRPAEQINAFLLLLRRKPHMLRLSTLNSVMEGGASLQAQQDPLE